MWLLGDSVAVRRVYVACWGEIPLLLWKKNVVCDITMKLLSHWFKTHNNNTMYQKIIVPFLNQWDAVYRTLTVAWPWKPVYSGGPEWGMENSILCFLVTTTAPDMTSLAHQATQKLWSQSLAMFMFCDPLSRDCNLKIIPQKYTLNIFLC